MLRVVSAIMLTMLAALLVACGAVFLQTRGDSVLSLERQQAYARQLQAPSAAEGSTDGIVAFDGAAGSAGASDTVEREKAQDKDRILKALCLWLGWGMAAEVLLAGAFGLLVLRRSRVASLPEEFRAARPLWLACAVGLLSLVATFSFWMPGARDEMGLMSGSARIIDAILLLVAAGTAFFLGTVHATPTKMLPSVPWAVWIRRGKRRGQ